MHNSDFYLHKNISNHLNQYTEKKEMSRETLININWSKIARNFLNTAYDYSGLKSAVNTFIAITEVNAAEKMVENLKFLSEKINENKKLGVYIVKDMAKIQDEICEIEKRNNEMSELTQSSIQIAINNLFKSVMTHYNECSATNKIIR